MNTEQTEDQVPIKVNEKNVETMIDGVLKSSAGNAIAEAKITEYMALNITDEKDTVGYTKVATALKEMKYYSGNVDEARKAIKRLADSFSKKVLEKVAPCITHLASEKQRIDNIKIEQKNKAEREALELFNGRTKRLYETGFMLAQTEYVLGEHKISIEQIKTVSVSVFDGFINKVITAETARKEKEKIEKDKRDKELLELSEFRALKKTQELKAAKEAGEISDYTATTVDEEKTIATGETHLNFTFVPIKPIERVEAKGTIKANLSAEVNTPSEKIITPHGNSLAGSYMKEAPKVNPVVRNEYNEGYNKCVEDVVKILNDPTMLKKSVIQEHVFKLKK